MLQLATALADAAAEAHAQGDAATSVLLRRPPPSARPLPPALTTAYASAAALRGTKSLVLFETGAKTCE